MQPVKIIISVLFVSMGLIFFFNNEKMGKGAAKFYQKLYTEKNLIFMFKAAGVVLILGGLVLILRSG